LKRIYGAFLSVILIITLFSGCSSKKDPEKEAAKPNNTASETKTPDSSTPSTNSKTKVFKANELLTAEEASSIVGTAVTIEEETLKVDSDTGTFSTYYDYELTSSTTIAALFKLVQNKEEAASSFESDKNFCGDNAEAIDGLGDRAFVHKALGQVNVLYKDYYIFIGFGEDNYNSKELNVKIAKKVLENIKSKL
jgi:hypothetical protein